MTEYVVWTKDPSVTEEEREAFRQQCIAEGAKHPEPGPNDARVSKMTWELRRDPAKSAALGAALRAMVERRQKADSD